MENKIALYLRDVLEAFVKENTATNQTFNYTVEGDTLTISNTTIEDGAVIYNYINPVTSMPYKVRYLLDDETRDLAEFVHRRCFKHSLGFGGGSMEGYSNHVGKVLANVTYDIQFTAEEMARVDEAAKLKGMTREEFIKGVLPN